MFFSTKELTLSFFYLVQESWHTVVFPIFFFFKKPKFWSQPKTSIPKLTIKSPNPLQPQREKRDRKPYCHQPRSSIFALPRDGDPPPSVPASHHDYHYTHSQAPVAATHHEHLPSLPCAAMTFTCSLPFHRKYPIDPISKVTQYSPLCVIHFL